jgi:phage tail-like protein
METTANTSLAIEVSPPLRCNTILSLLCEEKNRQNPVTNPIDTVQTSAEDPRHTMATTGDRKDPYRGFNFRVEIDNITVGAFSDVSGLSSDGDIVEFRDAARQLHLRKLTGLRKFSSITLKRGYTDNRELWNWRNNIVEGTPDRRNGAIVLMDEERNDVLRWEFEGGWIHKIDGPTFNAKGNDVTMESVELVVESLILKSKP